MNKFLVLIFCLIFSPAIAQTNHIEGWREARWGMTPDQVIAAFKGEALPAEKGKFTDTNILVNIPSVQIGKVKCKAAFIFTPGDHRLKQVTLQTIPGSVDIFFDLQEKLAGKYGKPAVSSDDDRPGVVSIDSTKLRAWNLGLTRIELKLWETLNDESHKPITSICTIRYMDVSQESDKNL